MSLEAILSASGLLVLLVRLRPWQARTPKAAGLLSNAKVSVIIPCRNEEERIAETLRSLVALSYPDLEIIVVDDQSTDRTIQVAGRFPVKIVLAPEKPASWCGKNWACWAGAQAAEGDILLFTDADTIHSKDSVHQALDFMSDAPADMISAPPFHLCARPWEKVLGPFLLFPLIATAYQSRPAPSRLYAIGQYLLFKKEAYFTIGGHKTISSSLTDDFDLAKHCLRAGLRYRVYPRADLYSVQMFNSVSDFINGWLRLIRLGLNRSSLLGVVEISLVLHLFLSFLWAPTLANIVVFFVGGCIMEWCQLQHTNTIKGTAWLAPLSVLLWIALSVLSLFHTVLGRRIVWRGRTYKMGGT